MTRRVAFVIPITVGSGATVQIVGPSKHRVALTLGPVSGGGLISYSNNKAIINNLGLSFGGGGSPYTLTLEDHGDIIRDAWFANNPGPGAVNGAAIETLEYPDNHPHVQAKVEP